MYDEVYTEIVAAGIAAKLTTPVMLSKTGEIVELEEESFGLKTHYMQLHPNKLVFIDEVGSSTSQTKDGHCGGEKFLVPLEMWVQIRAATKDTHFTMLGFTATTGGPPGYFCCQGGRSSMGAWSGSFYSLGRQ